MNNAINEIKNTLEATNSRITEAEDRISELEDRMVEIKEMRRISETSGTMLNAPNSNHRSPRRRRQKERL